MRIITAGCVCHERIMKSNTDSLFFLRWPCCDGAKRSEEYREFRCTAGLIPTLLHRDPSLISSDATIRLKATTETMPFQCWTLGPWTLKRFFFFYIQIVFLRAWTVLSVCVCVFVCVSVERGSFRRRGPHCTKRMEILFFFFFYHFKVHTSFQS